MSCENWASNDRWGALRDGNTLQGTCATSKWAQTHCAFTCCMATTPLKAREAGARSMLRTRDATDVQDLDEENLDDMDPEAKMRVLVPRDPARGV